MKQVDAAMKPKIFQNLTLPALNWFRWSSLVTVFFGFWYWGQFYVGPDAQREGGGAAGHHRFFLLLWIGVWFILFMVIKKMTPSGYVLGAITAILVYAAGWLFVNYTPVGRRRQPRALHRRGRRLRHRDAVQRLGHHLAQQQENHPRNAGRHSSRQRSRPGAPGLPGLADEFLLVRAAAVLHGGAVAFLQHGDLREVVKALGEILLDRREASLSG